MSAFVPASKTKRSVSWGKQARFSLSATTHAFPIAHTLSSAEAAPSFVTIANNSNNNLIQTMTATTTTTTTLPSGATFEPVLPDASALIAFGSIILLSALAVWVWANQVVPVSRTNLALSKKRGPVKEYLDELRNAAGASSELETTGAVKVPTDAATTHDIDSSLDEKDGSRSENEVTTLVVTKPSPMEQQPAKDTRALERWLFTDWLVEKASDRRSSKPGRQKEPALPVLKNAKWNSGDNPVLVASALIMAGVLFTAVTERVADVVF